MPTAPRPSATTEAAGEPQRDRPKRLPFLWLLSVYSGVEALLFLTAAFFMEPLGIVYFGVLGLVYAAVAASLYLRLRAGLYAALGLCGFQLLRLLLLGLRGQGASVSGLLFAALYISLVALYLYLRRRHFGRSEARRPRVLAAPGVGALAVVLVLGGGLLLLMTADDPRQSFPALEVQVPVPPAKENGFLVVEQMRKEWRFGGDELFWKVMGGLPRSGAAPSPEWLKAAHAELDKYSTCLAQTRELAGMPHFVEVPRRTGMAWMTDSRDWTEYTRRLSLLLAVSAAVQQADGHWAEALAETDRMVRLGALVGKESTTSIQSAVGTAIASMGLTSLRNAAGAVPDPALLNGYLGPPFSEKECRKGYNLGLAGDFQGDAGTVRAVRAFEGGTAGGLDAGAEEGVVHEGLFSLRMRANPLIKPNMTYNLFGKLTLPYVLKGDVYTPPPPNPLAEAAGLFSYDFLGRITPTVVNGQPGVTLRPNPREWSFNVSTAHAVGCLHFVRNPVGDTFVVVFAEGRGRYLRASVKVIAQARLTQIFLAMRCYQLEHGSLPDGLDALTPEYLKAIPVDPFTGKAFGYEAAGSQPRIWSVGPDQVPDPPGTREGDDVIVRLTFAGG